MTRHLTLTCATLALALPIAAMAGPVTGFAPAAQGIGPIHVAAGGCPPGLAKKNPACVPPGQAKQAYRIGDPLPDGFILIRTPSRYGLDPRRTYYERNGYVIQIDRETGKILNLIGAIADLLQ
ncbi:MAG: excinuclease ABC subunit A [Rhodobacterales bacterium]|nr:excinuclease ABC subunit A [Rhodobacterales bacterium]MDX5391204.1 excinuclease ABC subunit A [Rhodobacterales bacterium]MDX5490897.1 excinuclease ABC subunit A [Rhodobacterales bacterium]